MGDGDSRALHTPGLQSHGDPMASTGTNAVIRRFNRDTTLLATGLLGTLIFAAMVLAVQESRQKAPVLRDEMGQPGGEIFSLNANRPVLSNVVSLEAGNTGETSSVPTTNAEEGITPKINHPNPNARSWSPAHRQDSGRIIRPKNPRERVHPSLWDKIADVFVFWHRKPVPTERSRGWAQVAKKRERQKVSFTAVTNH